MRGDPGRRLADIVVCAAALVVASPVLVLTAVAIRLDSRGPVLFSQLRAGREGRPFRILKFRTMVADAERLGPRVSGTRDPRITRIGAFLRASKMDEMPQLWNVLRGDMTLVGPRAEVPEMLRHYTPEEREVLAVRPGLTGPGQIYFTTDQAAALDGVEDAEAHYVEHQLHPKLAIDLDYLRRRTWRTDVAVIARTIRVVALAVRDAWKDRRRR